MASDASLAFPGFRGSGKGEMFGKYKERGNQRRQALAAHWADSSARLSGAVDC
jgi:hypothetical protein